MIAPAQHVKRKLKYIAEILNGALAILWRCAIAAIKEITPNEKRLVEQAVEKAIKEYGNALRRLGAT